MKLLIEIVCQKIMTSHKITNNNNCNVSKVTKLMEQEFCPDKLGVRTNLTLLLHEIKIKFLC